MKMGLHSIGTLLFVLDGVELNFTMEDRNRNLLIFLVNYGQIGIMSFEGRYWYFQLNGASKLVQLYICILCS